MPPHVYKQEDDIRLVKTVSDFLNSRYDSIVQPVFFYHSLYTLDVTHTRCTLGRDGALYYLLTITSPLNARRWKFFVLNLCMTSDSKIFIGRMNTQINLKLQIFWNSLENFSNLKLNPKTILIGKESLKILTWCWHLNRIQFDGIEIFAGSY